jgi:hypothetical protein
LSKRKTPGRTHVRAFLFYSDDSDRNAQFS